MFQALIDRIEGAATSMAVKVAAWVAVAVPFFIAIAFALAALTHKLSEIYDPITSYLIMAGGLAALGGLGAVILLTAGRREEPAREPEQSSPSFAEAAAPLFDRDVLLAALTTAGPLAFPGLLRMGARNLPLLIMAFLVGILFLTRSDNPAEPGVADAASKMPAE